MISRDRVQAVVERIRPFIQADGGDIELVDVTGNRASVRMMGNCVGCPSAHLTLHLGLESVLREEMPELETLVVV